MSKLRDTLTAQQNEIESLRRQLRLATEDRKRLLIGLQVADGCALIRQACVECHGLVHEVRLQSLATSALDGPQDVPLHGEEK